MNRLTTTESPVLGWSELDRQHRSMLDGFRHLRQAPRRHQFDVAELHRLVAEVERHFVWEEAEMRQSAYPECSRHIRDHGAQLANLRDLLKYLDQGHEPLDEAFFLACMGWTERHIRSMDADFVLFVAERESWDLQQELKAWEYESQLADFPD